MSTAIIFTIGRERPKEKRQPTKRPTKIENQAKQLASDDSPTTRYHFCFLLFSLN